MASKDDAGAPGPLTQQLMQTAAHFGGGGSTGGGSSAADLFAQAMADAGLDPTGESAAMESDDPLTYAALSISQKTSFLPSWARDLRVAGLGKEEDAPEMFVFMRDKTTPATTVSLPHGVRDPYASPGGTDPVVTPGHDVTKAQTVTRAMNQPYLWDEEELDEAMKRMQDAGLDVKSFDDVNSVWQGLVERAAMTFTASEGEKKVTPWDVLDLVKREDETANGIDGEDELDPNRRTVTKSKSISEISEGEAWSTLQSNLSRMLGRDPSDQEVRDFTHRMNTLAAANPAITKTIAQYKNGEVVSQTQRTVKTGLTGDDIMRASYEDAQKDPEYGAFQAASTYYNSAVQALGAIGDV